MANDISIYQPRRMLRALEQAAPATSFLLDTFFSRVVDVSDTEVIDIDIVDKTGRKMAPFVSPRLEGKVIKDRGFKTRSYKPPYLKPKTITHAGDLLTRSPGYSIYDPADSLEMRASRKLATEMLDLRDSITRRMEWMAAQLMETGAMDIKGDGIDDVIDFGMKDTHKLTLSGTALWSNDASDPDMDIENWATLCGDDSGVYPTDVVLGKDAYAAYRKNPQVLANLDKLRLNLGQMAPEAPSKAQRFIRRLDSAGVNIWTYAEGYYDDDSETTKKFVPDNKIFIGSSQAYAGQHFGAIQDFDSLVPVAYFPKTWEEKDPSARMLMIQSAPLVAAHQIDAFLCAQVTA